MAGVDFSIRHDNAPNLLDRIRQLLSYESSTGEFTWNVQRPGRGKSGKVAGYHAPDGYVEIYVLGKKFKAHRLAWWFVHGEEAPGPIDHINKKKNDNRIDNLRCVKHQHNMQNISLLSANNKTGWTGVEPHKGKFVAAIEVNGKRKKFGPFKTMEEAIASYRTAKTLLHSGWIDTE